ncbi:hypothetical protein HZB74_00715 [Candidatus Saccharibacteria bacterium]|nr:hypothetical protein [Candidatus Saccharibacteria bacterium]
MKNDKLPLTREMTANSLIYEVVRPQRRKLSRYKLKKQAGLIEQIISDSQIMDM